MEQRHRQTRSGPPPGVPSSTAGLETNGELEQVEGPGRLMAGGDVYLHCSSSLLTKGVQTQGESLGLF